MLNLIHMQTTDSDKKDQESSENTNTISICDMMKDNTTKILKKIEFQIPSYMEWYSDLYTEQIHSLDDVFGTCYIWQKQYFDRLGIDQKTMKNISDYWNVITEAALSQIEMSTNLQKAYVQTRIAGIKSYDQYMHFVMDWYGKIMSQLMSSMSK